MMYRLLGLVLALSSSIFAVSYETIVKVDAAGASDLTGTPRNSIPTSSSIAVTAGQALLVYFSWNNDSVPCANATVTDTAGNTFTLVASGTSSDTHTRMQSFIAWNTVAHASDIITAATVENMNAPLISVILYSGIKRDGNPVDIGIGGFTAFANSSTSSGFTTTQTNEVVTMGARTTSSSITAGAGYTIIQSDVSNFHKVEHLITSVILTSSTTSFSGSTSSSWSTGTVSLKAAIVASGAKVGISID